MHLSSIVSERFGFAIPAGYVRMTEKGLLSHKVVAPAATKKKKTTVASGASSSKKKKKAKKKSGGGANGARALATADVLWLNTQEIAARLQKERHVGRRRWPADFVFVPFAENRSGDEWGWAPALGEPGANEAPVIFVPHNSDEVRIIAPTFAMFLFRMTLESLAQCPHEASEMSLAERIAIMRGSARVVVDFLPAELSGRLDRVLDFPVRKVTVRTLREKSGKFFRTSESVHLSLVAPDMAARIVREEMEDARVDQPLRIGLS